MNDDREAIFRTCQQLAAEHNLEVCLKENVKGALMAAGGAFVGGVLFGPIGMALGASAGGGAGAYSCKKYVPLCQVLTQMPNDQRILLTNHMLNVMQQVNYTDVISLMTLVATVNSGPRDMFIQGLNMYFNK